MPLAYHIDRERGSVFTSCSGNVTFEEVTEFTDKLRRDPAFDPDFRELVDLTELTAGITRLDKAREIAQRKIDPFSGKSRRAVVAPTTLAFGMARMYQVVSEDANFGVFRTLEEARRWLGLE